MDARKQCHQTGAKDALNAYCEADGRLLAAFVGDWTPDDPNMFATAYQEFRQALIASVPRSSAEAALSSPKGTA
jgi:hypothetical protein